MATLAQIVALPEEEVDRLVKEYELEGDGMPRQLLLSAYAQRGMLVPEDMPFARFPGDDEDDIDLEGAPLWHYMSESGSTEGAKYVPPLVAALKGEQLAAYMSIRLLLHLDSTMHYRVEDEKTKFYTLPEPRRVVTVAGVQQLHDPNEEVGEIEWDAHISNEQKVATGLGLMADLELGCKVGPLRDKIGEVLYGNETVEVVHRASLGEMWRVVLQDPALDATAYKTMRACMAYIDGVNTSPTVVEYLALANPGYIMTSIRALIDGISTSLHAHLQRALVRLPQPGQAYLEYVNRVLLNYRYYGVVGLRVSDLSEGDAVFKPIGGPILPAVNKTGLLPLGVRQMVDDYLVKVPTDAIILQRLLTLPSS